MKTKKSNKMEEQERKKTKITYLEIEQKTKSNNKPRRKKENIKISGLRFLKIKEKSQKNKR